MKEIQVKIRLLTPAFIGDAERKADVLNEKALKGALRFWWRAFLSDPTWDLKGLLEEESNIFGGQNNRSKFAINIVERNEGRNRSELDVSNFEGIKYLFYSKVMRIDRNKQVLAEDTYIEPNSFYRINLTFFDEKVVEPVLKSLWFLENFGGIGARARRGAGSFVVGIDNISLPESLKNWNLVDDEINSERVLNRINSLCYSARKTYDKLPLYTGYSSQYSKIKIVNQGSRNWMEALNFIGEKLMNERKSDILDATAPYRQEAQALHNFASGEKYEGPDPLTKTAFGLPIIYNFKERDPRTGRVTGLAREKVTAKGPENRRASPLFIKIGKGNKGYYVVLLVMWSQFLEDSKQVLIERSTGKEKTHRLSQPDNTAINDFLSKL